MSRQTLRGFINPTRTFPAPLAAIIEENSRPYLVYPSGMMAAIEADDWKSKITRQGGVFFDKKTPFEFGEVLYGISAERIFRGQIDDICSQLLKFVKSQHPDSFVYKNITRFLREVLEEDLKRPSELCMANAEQFLEEYEHDSKISHLLALAKTRNIT